MRKRSRFVRFLVVACVIALVGFAAVNAWARTAPAPPLGLVDGGLRPCPDRLNCVCSQSPGTAHYMAPIAIESAPATRQQLRRMLESEPRARIIVDEPDYLAAEVRSAVFGFVDDVEFLIDEPNRVLHFRSASRCGYSDLGVNRKRMTRLLARLSSEPQGAPAPPPSVP